MILIQSNNFCISQIKIANSRDVRLQNHLTIILMIYPSDNHVMNCLHHKRKEDLVFHDAIQHSMHSQQQILIYITLPNLHHLGKM